MKIKTRRYYIYHLAVIGGFIVAILPLRVSLFLAEIAGRISYAIVARQRNKALDSLKTAFPEKTDRELGKIAKGVFSNLCKYGVELLNIYKLNRKNLAQWIRPEGFEKVDKALSEKKAYLCCRVTLATGTCRQCILR